MATVGFLIHAKTVTNHPIEYRIFCTYKIFKPLESVIIPFQSLTFYCSYFLIKF